MTRSAIMGTISVIIPVYNTEQYIVKCLDSLMEQTYKDIEILLINDHSNKDCTELLETISKKDDRIKLFHFSQRMGVGAARNFGIKKASGEYIYFLDSDDYIPRRTLEILVNNIKNNDLIRGRIRATNFNSGMAVVFDGLFKTVSFEKNRFNLAKLNSTLNFLFKKEFIEKNRLSFSEEVKVYSDLAFIIPALINVEQVPYIKEAIYFRRKRNDPISNPSLIQSEDIIRIN